ncbi:polysaccharide biosynthesis/export family protein [Dickeya sp. ws52]|uniref:polysaccharide biosynthesis/export family protein n=1 Tax=Dickeya sp. ws52 TaxID=2576377 RepID=UPI00117DE4DA|nr:polysaccharide biosynthesis/export family protein [Dickeya sp. ws52]TYL42895.1 polysaccharide export protein [Dickeya sp. ws52]
MRIIKLCIFLCLSALLAGCTLSGSQQMDKPDNETIGYQLDEGDAVNILVYGEPEMTMKFILDKSGAITFPYIGQLVLKGKTPGQVSDELTRRLRGDYLQNPMVTVSVAEFRKFYITGEVEKPNGYSYEPGLNVEKALALAGGFTDRADRKDIAIRLSKSNQLIENVDVRYSVHPGDTVIVGMSFF